MSGRTAHEAVERYLDPIRDALGCLDAAAHIDRSGGYTVHQDGAWVVNGGSGIKLPGVGTFQVRQQFRVVECDPDRHDVTEGHFRITTLAYDYELGDQDGGWRWKMHWHPTGKSAATYPHIHLPRHPGHRATHGCWSSMRCGGPITTVRRCGETTGRTYSRSLKPTTSGTARGVLSRGRQRSRAGDGQVQVERSGDVIGRPIGSRYPKHY